MPFPDDPFEEGLDKSLILNSRNENDNLFKLQHEEKKIFKWLCSSPNISSIRVNTLITSRDDLIEILKDHIKKISDRVPNIYAHGILPDVVIIENYKEDEFNELKPKELEVIVDGSCGAALLRGAHVFAPGVLGLMQGSKIGDEVSVYADLSGKCKRGFAKHFIADNKIFIGNGVLHQNRSQIFSSKESCKGLAVCMKNTISRCPVINDKELWKYGAVLQNLPSIVCSYVLEPQPGDVVLDMCAAPGNKTTHLASLMNNKGILYALEKLPSKIKSLKDRCDQFSATCVQVCQYDSTKCLQVEPTDGPADFPPFPKEFFDKILLDAPCSGLGQRPQLKNKITAKELKSYVPLQRKLFQVGVNLLKPGGRLVYSTCTITLAENEEIVNWALKTFPDLHLIPALPKIGGPGWRIDDSSNIEYSYLQRFSHLEIENNDCHTDSIGFFIAHFQKL